MSEVVKGNFARDGFEIGDKRAIALHDWMCNLGRPATPEEMKAEIERLRRVMPAPEDFKSENNRITTTPEWNALHAFDAENNMEPARTIAERIAAVYGAGISHSMVDQIAHAIEDAINLGRRRGLLEDAAIKSTAR